MTLNISVKYKYQTYLLCANGFHNKMTPINGIHQNDFYGERQNSSVNWDQRIMLKATNTIQGI